MEFPLKYTHATTHVDFIPNRQIEIFKRKLNEKVTNTQNITCLKLFELTTN